MHFIPPFTPENTKIEFEDNRGSDKRLDSILEDDEMVVMNGLTGRICKINRVERLQS